LSFALHFLMRHPDVLRKARDEVDRVLGTEPPRFEQLGQLVYLDQILRETLRLWPTAPAFFVHARQ
jgi:cytochrome P450/NADPH-cytochrome P450 reductase